MKKIIALILAMVMALSLVACGQTAQDDKSKDDANSTSAKTFIMGIDAEYPPFSYLDADGNYTGFDVEVCKAACDLLGAADLPCELGSEAGAAGRQGVRLRLVRHDDPRLHEGGRLCALHALL